MKEYVSNVKFILNNYSNGVLMYIDKLRNYKKDRKKLEKISSDKMKDGIDLFNKISGLNVSVELSSLWANRRKKIKQELNEKEVDQDDGGSKETDPNNNGSDDNGDISSTSNQQNV